MFHCLSQLLGLLLALLLSATLGSAGSLDARSPQDTSADNSISLHFYTPTPSHTIPSWYTMTSSASQSTATVSFAFGGMQDTSVCGQDTVSWVYSGDPSYMMGIAAMAVDVGSTASSSTLPTVITILDGGLVNGQSSYNWSPVNVPPGVYMLEVSIPNVASLYYSEIFYVVNSSDYSCLTSSSSSTTSQLSSTSGTASSTSTANSLSASSSSVGNSSGVPVVGAVSGGSTISGGGIAGVVIGALAFVGGLIAVLILLRRCRTARATGAPRGGLFEKRRPRGAVSINSTSRAGSFSSTHGGPAPGLGSTFGMAPQYDLNDPSQSSLGHGASNENVGAHSITGVKPLVLAPAELGMAPAAVHRAPHAYRDSFGSVTSGSTTVASPGGVTSHYRPSRHSSLLYTSDPFVSGLSTPSPRPSGDYQRPSGNQSQVPVALFSPSSAASTPRTFDSPGVPRDISIVSYSSPDLAYDTDLASPSAAAVSHTASRRAPPVPPVASSASAWPASRSKSASARKPVPVYAPSASGEALELVEPQTPHSVTNTVPSYYNSSTRQHSGVSLVPSSGGNDWSSAAVHSHSPVSGVSPTSSGSYLSHASGHSLIGFAGRAGMPELNHKSSFGDRQLHVLMPDPPPQEMQ